MLGSRDISAFQYEACHGFRVGASVHNFFMGGVYAISSPQPVIGTPIVSQAVSSSNIYTNLSFIGPENNQCTVRPIL